MRPFANSGEQGAQSLQRPMQMNGKSHPSSALVICILFGTLLVYARHGPVFRKFDSVFFRIYDRYMQHIDI